MRRFSEALRSERLAISTELTLEQDSTAADIAQQAGLFKGRADAMQVADNPLAWVHMSPVAASSLLMSAGMDAIPILSCRDRNRIALQSDLMGLRALGVSSVFLMRGRRVGKRHALHASTVFDLSGRELIAMASGLNEIESEGAKNMLFIGTGAKVSRTGPGWTPESLTSRADAGAEFLQTQICYNLDLLRDWMNRLVETKLTWRYSVIVSLAVLPSAKVAGWVKQNMADSRIPDEVITRLEQASDPEDEGVNICAETMQKIAEVPGVSGIHLMATGQPKLMAEAIDRSGLRG